ncbi:hypothetical protein ACFY3M_02045 [Streptomyces mirabilis]|uniref:hypothetical protein n=1 Tax=Streptomyces mirabilis TaxID=68239 RepID=UPI0036D01643
MTAQLEWNHHHYGDATATQVVGNRATTHVASTLIGFANQPLVTSVAFMCRNQYRRHSHPRELEALHDGTVTVHAVDVPAYSAVVVVLSCKAPPRVPPAP